MSVVSPTRRTANASRSRRTLEVIVLVALVLSAVLTGCSRSPALLTTDGATHHVADHAGHWLLVNYWAQWCAPCRQEIPELNALFTARPGEVAVYGVNYDGVSGAALIKLSTEMGIQFPVLANDPAEALGLLRPEVLPTSYLIAPDGRRLTLIGPQTQASIAARLAAAQN